MNRMTMRHFERKDFERETFLSVGGREQLRAAELYESWGGEPSPIE